MEKFVHLHLHSNYSLLDGIIRIPELMKKVKNMGQTAVAITDHAYMSGIFEGDKEAKANDIKFIPGCECYWVPNALIKSKEERDSETDMSRKHLLLLAKNNEGYKRLLKISSWGLTTGHYYRGRIDDSVLEQFGTDGIIASSACFLPNKNLDVLTKDGIKNLLDIKAGDYVQSHTGEWKHVIIPTTRKYKGNFYEINIHSNMPFTVTENHKFFILRDNEIKGIEAKDLKVNDYCIASIDETINDIKNIKLEKTSQVLQHSFKLYDLEINNDFIQFLVLYIRYGALFSPGKIKFIFNNDDIKNQQLLIQLINKLFNIQPYIDQQDNCIIYWYHCSDLYLNLFNWFYNNENTNWPQKLPEFLKFLPREKQLYFIQQLLIQYNKKIYCMSKQLAYDILFIFNRLYINCTLNLSQGILNIYNINILQEQYEQIINNNINDNDIFIWNGKKYLKYPIKSIQSFYDKKQVYCLNVEDDHSFTICNIKVFNCLAGRISQLIIKGDMKNAKKVAEHYAKMFKDGFYLELMPHNDKKKIHVQMNQGLIEIAQETGIPLIATCDAHFLNKSDKETHDILLAVQTKTTISNPNRWTFDGDTFYVMSQDEVKTAFNSNGHEVLNQRIIEEAINNTYEIAKQCNVEFSYGKPHLPKINPYIELKTNPKLENEFNIFETRRLMEIAKRNNTTIEDARARVDPSSEMIRFLCIHGYKGLYNQHCMDAKHLSLFMYELDTIISTGFCSYFLILEEIIRWAASQSIATGCARGCHHKQSKVNVLSKGLININQIQINDQVLGLDNKYHNVLKTYEYDCNEDLIQIKTENGKIMEGLTKDHKVLGLKKKDYIEDKEYTIDDLTWYSIDELTIDDYVVEIN